MFPASSPPASGQVTAEEGDGQPATTTTAIYWTDPASAGQPATGSPLSRPSPSVSNCGLVIVQVDSSGKQAEDTSTAYVQVSTSAEEVTKVSPTDGSAYVTTEKAPDGSAYTWQQQPYQLDMGSSAAAHQLIHGLPPPEIVQSLNTSSAVATAAAATEEEEIIDEEVGEDEEEADEEEHDEGYRTQNSSTEASPRSTTSSSSGSGSGSEQEAPPLEKRKAAEEEQQQGEKPVVAAVKELSFPAGWEMPELLLRQKRREIQIMSRH